MNFYTVKVPIRAPWPSPSDYANWTTVELHATDPHAAATRAMTWAHNEGVEIDHTRRCRVTLPR